jgi:hypothetical protein
MLLRDCLDIPLGNVMFNQLGRWREVLVPLAILSYDLQLVMVEE